MTTVSMLVGGAGVAPNAYTIPNSLRFRAANSAQMTKSWTTSSTDLTRQTFSLWFKRGLQANNTYLIGAYNSAGNALQIGFNSVGQLNFNQFISAGSNNFPTNSGTDPAAWYHIVWAWDTTQASINNRYKIYINGVLMNITNSIAQNTASDWGVVGNPCAIGANGNNAAYYDGYLADFYFIDGQVLSASSFGTYDSNGIWQPIAYTGTYGPNGVHLPFTNTSSTTTLGNDLSGNGNNFTTTGFSVTAGLTYDVMKDTPTPSSTTSNYPTLNPLYSSGTISNGALKAANTGSTWLSAAATIGISSGKYYWEATATNANALAIGVATNFAITNGTNYTTPTQSWTYDGRAFLAGNGGIGTAGTYGATYATNDVIGVAVDYDNQTITFYKNNVSQGLVGSGGTLFNSITGFSGLNGKALFPWFSTYGNTSAWQVNFGQQAFVYTPPTGYVALNTSNLPSPSIPNGGLYADVSSYTGNGTTQTVSTSTGSIIGSTFTPNFVWIKNYNSVQNHYLFDTIRGTNNVISSNATTVETTTANTLTAFTSTGFTVGTVGGVNGNTNNLAAYQWAAGGTASSNTNGSITSSVSANTTSGFSIVTYTGTGANGTVGHGLSSAPTFILIKARNSAVNWAVYHGSLANTQYMVLNSTAAAATSTTVWNSTSPTSSVISLGTDSTVNASGTTYVAYCWAPVYGFSIAGTYTGNGAVAGPWVHNGFRPKFIIIKASSTTGDWSILNASNGSSPNPSTNTLNNYVFADTTAVQNTSAQFCFFSNAFQPRDTNAIYNTSGVTYIYFAFAENPFNIARGR